MGWIDTEYDYKKKTHKLVFHPYQTDLNIFQIVKTKCSNTCTVCRKSLPPKSYVYGKDWVRLCLDCGNKFNKQGIKEFEKIIEMIKTTQKEHSKNKTEWEANNILAKL